MPPEKGSTQLSADSPIESLNALCHETERLLHRIREGENLTGHIALVDVQNWITSTRKAFGIVHEPAAAPEKDAPPQPIPATLTWELRPEDFGENYDSRHNRASSCPVQRSLTRAFPWGKWSVTSQGIYDLRNGSAWTLDDPRVVAMVDMGWVASKPIPLAATRI